MSGRTFWVTGIPGTYVRGALRSIADQYPPPSSIVSIEENLVDVYIERKIGGKSDCDRVRKSGGFKVIVEQAPSVVASLWSEAAKRALVSIKEQQSDGDVFLTFHAVYHPDKFSDFYSAVNLALLSEFPPPDRVINLIDDIGDVAYRLRKPSQMFAFQHLELGSVERAIRDLLTLLEWRISEFTVTRLVASLFGKKAFQLAVKHPVSSAVKYLTEASRAIYVSHPISESRRKWTAEEGWSPFVEDVQRFTRELGRNPELLPIAPTTIDEKRIDAMEVDGDKCFVPRLRARWNLLAEDPLVPPEEDSGAKNWLDPSGYFDGRLDESPLSEETKGEVRRLNGLLSALESRIDAQVNARDHTLVQQCPLLTVYRPYSAYNVSGGVAEEVKHGKSLAEDRKTVYFVHKEYDFCLRDIGRIAHQAPRSFVWGRNSDTVKHDEIVGLIKEGLHKSPPADYTQAGIKARVTEVLAENGIALDGIASENAGDGPFGKKTAAELERLIDDAWAEIAELVAAPDGWKLLADHWIVGNGSPEEHAGKVIEKLLNPPPESDGPA